MRFRKRIQVFPGFVLNLSGSGVSSTIGFKGASINISRKGSYLNLSTPGTGIYNRIKIGGGDKIKDDLKPDQHKKPSSAEAQRIIEEIMSAENSDLTSSNFMELKETLLNIHSDKIELHKELESTRNELRFSKVLYILSCILIIGFIVRAFRKSVKEKEEYIADLENQISKEYIDISFTFDAKYLSAFNKLREAYEDLINTECIWDITASVAIDRVKTRSSASSSVFRERVNFGSGNIGIIKSDHEAFHWENKNGGDLYIYPAFVIITNSINDFAIIDIKDFELSLNNIHFNETESVPSDSRVIGHTWTYVNKNGQPDRRFNNNYEIPVVEYAGFNLSSTSGLNEMYCLSNYNYASGFSRSLKEYQESL